MMARVVTTRGLLVLALVVLLVSIPASSLGTRKSTTARPRRATTVQTKSSTIAKAPSSTIAQPSSSIIAQGPSTTTIRMPSTTTIYMPGGYPGGNVVRGSSQLEWTANTFPNPQLQPRLCSRGTRPSWVCDPYAVLSKKQADTIDNLLKRQSAMGHCRCGKKCAKSSSHKGIQGAVAIVNKMYFMDSNPTHSELQKEAARFAEYLRDKSWEYELCHDDYVILVSVRDRQVVTAIGDNAREIMTDACVQRVLDEVRPLLSKRDYGRAVERMVNKYTDVLRSQHSCKRAASGHKGPASVGAIIGGIIGFIGLICCCGICCYCFSKRNQSDEG